LNRSPRPRASGYRRRARLFLLGGGAAFVLLAALPLALRTRPARYVPGTEAATSAEITRSRERPGPTDTALGPPIRRPAPGPARGTENATVQAALPQGTLRFTDVAEAAGIRFRHFHGRRSTQLPEDMGSGAAWGDYDGDGDPDLFLVNESGPLTATQAEIAGSPARSVLYRNNGDGAFTDVTDAAGAGVRGLGLGAAWGDYDGDGDLDLFITRFGTNVLLQNRGGVFSDVTRGAGVGVLEGFWTGASWADYDRDGDLDLYVCGYVRYETPNDVAPHETALPFKSLVPFTLNPSSYSPERNLLYRNDGGEFREVAKEAGVDNPTGRSLSAAWCDFDGDGWLDLYVANDVSDNAMFHNRGDGRFRDVSHSAWVADYRGAMGLATGDWDNDGDFDIFITHWIAQENGLYVNETRTFKTTPLAPLRFVDQADITGLGPVTLDVIGWGTGFFDYDNDGRLDLFAANGSTFQRESDRALLVPMRNQLFWNAGDGFDEVGKTMAGPFAVENVGRGAAFADYDADGDVDVAVTVNGGPARLLRNDGGSARAWLRVVVRGKGAAGRPATTSFATGALVRVKVGEETQIRQVGGGSSYLSQAPPGEVFFGLGAAPSVDLLEIVWPSGVTQAFRDVPTRATVVAREGGKLVVRAARQP